MMRVTGARRPEFQEKEMKQKTEPAKHRADDAQHDRAEESRPEAGDEKAGHEGGGELKHERVDDQPENPESKNGERQGENFQNKADGRIDQADDDGRQKSAAETAHFDAGKKIGNDQQAGGADEPVKQQIHHNSSTLTKRKR